MKIRFWGVRGSIPTPLSADQVRAKISAAVQKISEDDLKSQDSRQKFVASLPQRIFGTTGGNTSCVEITSKSGAKIILDAGTGIRLLGKSHEKPANRHYNIFFSHFHWDHIQGLPFFDPIYDPDFSLDFFSPVPDMQKILASQMTFPYYPVEFSKILCKTQFHTIPCEKSFKVGGVSVLAKKMNHPGKSFSYSLLEDEKKIVYATDVELVSENFLQTDENARFFGNADILILDAQYTENEAKTKKNWGHSAFSNAIDFAIRWKVKNLYFFHLEPTYDDKTLASILKSARWYANYVTHTKTKIFLSCEGEELEI